MTLTIADASGHIVVSDLGNPDTVYHIPPGETRAVAGVFTRNGDNPITGNGTKMTVKVTRTVWDQAPDETPGGLSTSAVTLQPGQDGSALATFALTSTYRTKVADPQVRFVLRDSTGKIIGGESNNETIEHVFIRPPGNATIKLTVKIYFPPPGVVTATAYPSFVPP